MKAITSKLHQASTQAAPILRASAAEQARLDALCIACMLGMLLVVALLISSAATARVRTWIYAPWTAK